AASGAPDPQPCDGDHAHRLDQPTLAEPAVAAGDRPTGSRKARLTFAAGSTDDQSVQRPRHALPPPQQQPPTPHAPGPPAPAGVFHELRAIRTTPRCTSDSNLGPPPPDLYPLPW